MQVKIWSGKFVTNLKFGKYWFGKLPITQNCFKYWGDNLENCDNLKFCKY